VFSFGVVGPAVGDVYLAAEFTQFFDQVHYFGVAQVWAVFFEGQAHDLHARTSDGLAVADHGAHTGDRFQICPLSFMPSLMRRPARMISG